MLTFHAAKGKNPGVFFFYHGDSSVLAAAPPSEPLAQPSLPPRRGDHQPLSETSSLGTENPMQGHGKAQADPLLFLPPISFGRTRCSSHPEAVTRGPQQSRRRMKSGAKARYGNQIPSLCSKHQREARFLHARKKLLQHFHQQETRATQKLLGNTFRCKPPPKLT